MNTRKLNIGGKQLTREFEVLGAIFVLFAILIFSVYFGLNYANFNLDTRNQAAGKTVFLENGQDLQAAIDNAGPSDAIFLKPGSYTPSGAQGFLIRNKTLRILGAGKDFTTVGAGSGNYVFNITNSIVSFESLTISGSKTDGIKVDDSSTSSLSVISAAITNNSGAGISSGAKTSVQKSILDQNGDGITTSNNLDLNSTVIKNSAKSGVSILTSSTSDTKILNTLITNNAGTAISVGGGKTVSIKNVTAYDNGSGIVEGTNTATTTILNTTVQRAKADGISLRNSASTVKYSNSYANNPNYTPTSLGSAEGNLSVNSGFTSETAFQLASGSPLKSVGSTDEKNADGSRIDIGAYGGSPVLLAANGVPTITSTPPEFTKPGQAYSYELVATDPDGDALSYVVLNNNIPKWLKQDKNKFTGTPTQSDIGYYGVMVVVSDRKGGNIVQPISINVLPESRSIPQTTASPTPTQANQNPAPQITITSPSATSIFSKNSSSITWKVTNGVEVDKFVVSYSTDGQNYTTIATLPGSAISYNWSDVSKLTNGKYFIKVEATDKGNPPVTVATVSPQFEVKNPEENTTDTITITKINPADNDVVQSRRQVIVVEFQPENDLDKTQTKLLVNGKEVAYDTTRKTIFHQPNADYEGNTVQVEVQLVTAKGGKASRQWSFNIQATTNPDNTTPTVDTTQSICLPGSTSLCIPNNIGLALLACLILVILLLILYFVVKFIKTLRDQREGNLEAEFTEYYDDKSVYPENATVDTNKTPTYEEGQTASNDQDMSQYYTEGDAVQETQTVDPNAQPVQEVDNSQFTEGDKVITNDQTAYDPNVTQQDQSQFTQDQSLDQSNTQSPFTQANDQSGQMTQDQTQYNDQSQGQVPVDQNATAAAPATNDQYIQDLKSKYGVTDDQINQYNQGQQAPVDPNAPQDQQQNNQSTGDQNA